MKDLHIPSVKPANALLRAFAVCAPVYSAVFAHTLCAIALAKRWLDVNTNNLSCAWCFSINAFSMSSFSTDSLGRT